MDCNYIKESRKLYVNWKRGKKPLHTMSQDELIMLDEYIQILYHSSRSHSELPSVSSHSFPRIPKKLIFVPFILLFLFLLLR